MNRWTADILGRIIASMLVLLVAKYLGII